MSDNWLGIRIGRNMMEGSPTRTKSGGNYRGLVIPPCGDYDTKDGKVPRPPWLTAIAKGKSMSLDEEIGAFMQYMEPTPQELRMRTDLVQRFTKLISSFNLNASVRAVGSYVTNLYLPTSDIDMVVTFGGSSGHLSTLLWKIHDSGFASQVEDVLLASVPLIRITDKITGIQIDLTAADTHAIKATEAVQKWLQPSSPVKPLLFVVKMFLSVRRCGTTFTGGINSYALFWMVVAWVKLEMQAEKRTVASFDYDSLITSLEGLSMSKENVVTSSSSSVDLGELLIKFLRFYGEEFNYETRAIRITPTPAYHHKTYGY